MQILGSWMHTTCTDDNLFFVKLSHLFYIFFYDMVSSQVKYVLKLGVYRHFQQCICYIAHVAVNFIGGGNWSTRREPPTCQKWLTNFIT